MMQVRLYVLYKLSKNNKLPVRKFNSALILPVPPIRRQFTIRSTFTEVPRIVCPITALLFWPPIMNIHRRSTCRRGAERDANAALRYCETYNTYIYPNMNMLTNWSCARWISQARFLQVVTDLYFHFDCAIQSNSPYVVRIVKNRHSDKISVIRFRSLYKVHPIILSACDYVEIVILLSVE